MDKNNAGLTLQKPPRKAFKSAWLDLLTVLSAEAELVKSEKKKIFPKCCN